MMLSLPTIYGWSFFSKGKKTEAEQKQMSSTNQPNNPDVKETVKEKTESASTTVETKTKQTVTKNNTATPMTFPGEAQVVNGVLLFDRNSITLEPESLEMLKEHVEYLKKNLTTHLLVEGHSDAIEGNEAERNQISLLRAEAVKDYFVKAGISVERISILAHGDKSPTQSNLERGNAEHNRRVVLTYQKR